RPQPSVRRGLQQRLVIVRSMKIDKVIAELFQNRQCCWRSVDELARASGDGETSLDDEIVLAPLDARFDKLPIPSLHILSAEHCLDGTQIGSSADQRFVRAFSQ